MADEREAWNERYRSGEFDPPESPSPLLEAFVDSLPDGRALNVATGTGRNALFLAEQGYAVEAIDVAEEALAIARDRAAERSLDVEWIRADLDEYDFPKGAYDVVVVDFYWTLDLLPDLEDALAPGGLLLYEHHLQSADPIDRGPSGDRYRFRSNDLLRACLDLTILHYEERTRVDKEGRTAAIVTLVARNSAGGTQQYLRRS